MMVKRLSKTSKTLIGKKKRKKKKKKNPTYLPYFFQPCYLKPKTFYFKTYKLTKNGPSPWGRPLAEIRDISRYFAIFGKSDLPLG